MKLITVLALVTIFSCIVGAQSLIHPLSTTDGGGGRSTGSGLHLLGSIGQPAAGTGSDADTGITIEGGIIPPLRSGSGASTTADIAVQSAWNMISLPVLPPTPEKSTLLPTAISSAFAYLPPPTGYTGRDSLFPGTGYWVKFPGVGTIGVTGTALSSDTVDVFAGWNIIGALTYPARTADVIPVGGTSVLGSYFAFTPGFGYTSEDTLEPGRAYWVKVDQAGGLLLTSGSFPIPPSGPVAGAGTVAGSGDDQRAGFPPLQDAGTVTFTAADGQVRELHIAPASADISLSAHELPPLPPGGAFDVRFASQRSVETFGRDGSSRGEAAISITGAAWPVTVGYAAGASELPAKLGVLQPGGERLYDLSGGGTRTLDGPAPVSLHVGAGDRAAADIPSEFRLYQNHPNPFNPTTTVTFDLPQPAGVKLVITNSIGQTVATVVDRTMDAGRHSVAVDGTSLPTGVYFYRITAGDRSDVGKMLLMK